MTTIEKIEQENEIIEVDAFETVEEIEAENSDKLPWIIGGAVVIVGAGYALVKKVIIPGARKIKAKLEEKKAKKNAYQYVDFEDVAEES